MKMRLMKNKHLQQNFLLVPQTTAAFTSRVRVMPLLHVKEKGTVSPKALIMCTENINLPNKIKFH